MLDEVLRLLSLAERDDGTDVARVGGVPGTTSADLTSPMAAYVLYLAPGITLQDLADKFGP